MDATQVTSDQLSTLLLQMLQPDTQKVKETTAVLKEYFKTTPALENLLILLATSQDTNVRQMSCVFLRKIIGNLWHQLQADPKAKTKELLLERFVAEPVTLIKKNIAEVIGQLSMILIPNNEWEELFSFFFKFTQSDQL